MSNKRQQEFQGGGERYGGNERQRDVDDKPMRATAAQMAKRTIAGARKPSGSQRSSRQNTPTANPFASFGQQNGQQSMPSFQTPDQSATGSGGGFNFAVNASSNPFAQTNGASATPPPPSRFQFGAQPQQNGGSNAFGNSNTSFGSTFGASGTQPQQNGFNPSNTLFGQSQPNGSTNITSSAFGGFGQSNQTQPQQNGVTPSTATTSSFPSFGKQNENPFKSFGQSQPQTQSTPGTTYSFGQNTQPNGDKSASTPFSFGQTNSHAQPNGNKPLFGSTSQAEQTPKDQPSNPFSGIGQANQAQQNGEKSLFPSTTQAEQTSIPSSTDMFTSQQSTGTGLFGSTPPPESGSQVPKAGESIFSTLKKNEGITSTMFTQSRDATPQPPASNPFGAPSRPSSSEGTEQTPKPGNLFGGLNQPQVNGVKQNLFGSTLQTEQQTPKTTSNPFGGTFAQAPASSGTPAFNLGQSQQDTSMTTPGNTPQKQFQSSSQQPAAGATIENNAAQSGKGGLFDRITPRDDPPSTDQKSGFNPSPSFFNTQPSSSSRTDERGQETPAPKQDGSLFDRVSSREQPTPATKQSSFTPATSGPSAAPWLSHGPSALTSQSTPSQPPFPATPVRTSTQSAVANASSEEDNLKSLNEGLRAHLATQDANADWTSIMHYYVKQAAKIRNKPQTATSVPAVSITTPSAPNTVQSKPSAPTNVFASPSSSAQQATPKPAPAATPAFSLTPKQSNTSSTFQPPQTAPAGRKRPAEDDVEAAPATEKRSRQSESTNYPPLPQNTSQTSRLFESIIDRSTGAGSLDVPKQRQEASQTNHREEASSQGTASNGSKPSTTSFTPSAAGFKPSTTSFTPASTGFTPSTSGFKPSGFTPSAPSGMPAFSAPSGGGGFLAAFGKKAGEQEEKDRKKRKAEDYDSDEETEEAWAERDKKEQEAKRQKVLEAAKSGAGFTPSNAGTPAPESVAAESAAGSDVEADDEETQTPMGQGRSLFDRVTPRDPPATAPSKMGLFSNQTPSSYSNPFMSKTPSGLGGQSSTSNIFGNFSKPRESIEQDESDKTEAEKEQGLGDNTWKPNTPIKFGASTIESTTPAAPPPFGNLFGNNAQKPSTDNSGHLNIPKPTFGFGFGGQPFSSNNSRASTPGVTTDGEGASTAGEGEDDETAAPPEPQVEDQTGLRDSEKENEDLLFSAQMAKGMKWEDKKNDSGDMALGWADKGKGPLYVLKHKETGKVRLVLKVPPYGAAKMNFAPLKDVRYEVKGSSGKLVQGVFIDHLNGNEDSKGKLTKWMIHVGKEGDAERLAEILMAERS